jgi:hypothetical protein
MQKPWAKKTNYTIHYTALRNRCSIGSLVCQLTVLFWTRVKLKRDFGDRNREIYSQDYRISIARWTGSNFS